MQSILIKFSLIKTQIFLIILFYLALHKNLKKIIKDFLSDIEIFNCLIDK